MAVTEILGATLINTEAVYTVVSVSVGITLFSSLLHRKMVNRNKMDEIRAKIEAHQKKYMEAQKANDTKKIAQLDKEQAQIMGLVKENMMASMKPSLVTLPVVLLVIWVMGAWYGKIGAIIDMPFGIPFLTKAFEGAINPMTGLAVARGMDWFGLYILISIGTALILELVLRKVFKV